MATVKTPFWYILEGARLWNGYKGQQGSNDSIAFLTPTFKDIDGVSYTNIYATKYGPRDYGDLNHMMPNDPDYRYQVDNCFAFKGIANAYTSFDEFTTAYVSDDTLQNYSDYLINECLDSTCDSEFNIGRTRLANTIYNDETLTTLQRNTELMNQLIKRVYHIHVKNTTANNVTINSIKITKKVYTYVGTENKHQDPPWFSEAFDEIEVLYAIYFLDEPLTLSPDEEQILVYSVDCNQNNTQQNFLKNTTYWYACESSRLANLEMNDLGNEILNFRHGPLNPNVASVNSFPGLRIYYGSETAQYIPDTIVGGIIPNHIQLVNFLERSKFCYGYTYESSGAFGQVSGYEDYSNFTFEFITDNLSPLSHLGFSVILSSGESSSALNSIRVSRTTAFRFANNEYSRLYTIKISNSLNRSVSIDGLKLINNYIIDFSSGGYGVITSGDLIPAYQPEYESYEYGRYLFPSSISIPPADFKILTFVIKPDRIEFEERA